MYVDSVVDSTTSATVLIDEPMRKPRYLLPEHMSRNDGVGPAMDLGADRGKLFVATLGINHVVEHGGLIVSIWGSADGVDWGMRPLVSFPQKYYCGLYSSLLNLVGRPEIRYLRPQWSMKGWGEKNSTAPLFSFNLFVEESGSRLSTAVA
jgi:hypothetical protein